MDYDISNELEVQSGLVTKIKFSVATEADIEKISVLDIDTASKVTDPELGLPNHPSKCSKCDAKDLKHCEGHFGAITFPYTVLHPYFLSEVTEILNNVCPGCKSIRQEVWAKDPQSKNNQPRGCKYCAGGKRRFYPTMKFKVSSQEIFRRSAIIVEICEKIPKGKVLPTDYWEFLPKDLEQDGNCLKPYRRILSHAQVHQLLDAVDVKFIRKFVSQVDSIFLNCFPVTPNCHRVTELTSAGSNKPRLIFDERTRAYKKIVDFRGIANELSSRVLDCLKISKLNSDKTPSNSFAQIEKKKNSEYTFNTSGLRWMKDVVLGKRNDYCFRMVIVGDPDLKLNEIGIPCQIAESLFVSEHVNRQNKEKLLYFCELRILEKGYTFVRREGSLVRLSKKEQLKIGDICYRPLVDGDLVLINRPPSIHQHSLIAFSVRVLPIISVLSINPLCCSPFRGDFDGDCFHGYVPQSIDARVELQELVALDRQLINGQSGRNLLSLGQDSLAAAYLLLEDNNLLDNLQMQQLKMFCPRQMPLPAIVKSPQLNSSVWTGKQLFSMLLPPDFEYSYPANNVVVSNGELLSTSDGSAWLRDIDGNLFINLVRHCKSNSLNVLYSAQQVLCEWLSMRGLSVSLSDLYLSDLYSRKNMMDDVFIGLKEAEHACNFKQLMVTSNQNFLSGNCEESENIAAFEVENLHHERQKAASLNQASVDAFRNVFRDIQSLAYKYGASDNSFLIMSKAGSKGNLVRLVQHTMCLGLQHSLVQLSFRFPHELSCNAWNHLKTSIVVGAGNTPHASVRSYIPCAVVENSFLTGLNPVECFVHSVTNRDSSFSDNADLPGTLTRRLMFFMRDLYASYDGTVRNAYGNQVVQFSYDFGMDLSSGSNSNSDCDAEESVDVWGKMGGQPAGSLSACAISEAAYGALDQPISLLETSPLLNLKNMLECGSRRKNGDQTVSLYLSQRLGRQRYGFEYGAIEVQNHLERVTFSDLVSTVMVIFSPQTGVGKQFSPWICHFHLCKKILRRRKLKVHSIIDRLYRRYDNFRIETKSKLQSVLISTKNCALGDAAKDGSSILCITVAILENTKDSLVTLDIVRDNLIPYLLKTAIKGFQEVKKVEILWNDRLKVAKSCKADSGELYLRVTMSASGGNAGFWNLLKSECLQIMNMIDWSRSHPDNVHHFCSAYGIDAGWKYFLNNFESAIADTGKTILPRHLILVADSLSATGEFVGLNLKGMARQRKHASVSSPFVQACFSTPGASFLKAAKADTTDNLHGILDSIAWGNYPAVGTRGQFDLIYDSKGYELNKPVDVYGILEKSSDYMSSTLDDHNHTSDKWGAPFKYKNRNFSLKGKNNFGTWSIPTIVKQMFTLNDIQKLARALRFILQKYPVSHQLSEFDMATLKLALNFHPHKDEKFGAGIQYIKVGNHPKYESTRCFFIVRTDGTVEDFSYHKCILGALEIVAPERAKGYRSKFERPEISTVHFNGDKNDKVIAIGVGEVQAFCT